MLAVMTGWLLGHRAKRPDGAYAGADPRIDQLDALVSRLMEQNSHSRRAGTRQFAAGIAFGILGNAVIALIVEVSAPGVPRVFVFGLIAVVCVAYADATLRAANLSQALVEAVVLVLLLFSIMLSGTVFARLQGLGCEGCEPLGSVVIASTGYFALSLVGFAALKLLQRMAPQSEP